MGGLTGGTGEAARRVTIRRNPSRRDTVQAGVDITDWPLCRRMA